VSTSVFYSHGIIGTKDIEAQILKLDLDDKTVERDAAAAVLVCGGIIIAAALMDLRHGPEPCLLG
jgi:hypothetical protein